MTKQLKIFLVALWFIIAIISATIISYNSGVKGYWWMCFMATLGIELCIVLIIAAIHWFINTENI